MKNTFLSLFVVSTTATLAQFAPAIQIDTLTMTNVLQMGVTDFGNDGLPDILTANFHWPKDNVMLFTNTGSNQFQPQIIAGADSLDQLYSFDIADINNDGRQDFAISEGSSSTITWYENTGTAFLPHVVDTALDFTEQILLRDMDNNGMVDVLSRQHVEIVLYLALSPGVFDTARVIHGTTEFYSMDAADYNGDGLRDVAVGSGGFEVVLNNGGGNFSLVSQQGLAFCFGLRSADMDGDGDTDVAAYESLRGIMYYANDGSGHFALEDTILSSTDNFEIFSIADLDCDTDPDVYATIPQTNQVVWMENDGAADFSSPHLVHTQNGGLLKAGTVADMNADGVPDLLWGHSILGMNLNQCTTVGLVETKAGAIRVYPNPATDVITVDAGGRAINSLELSDPCGRLLLKAGTGTFSVETLPAGTYFLRIRTAEGSFGSKVIKN